MSDPRSDWRAEEQADLSGKEGAPLPLLGTNSEGQRGREEGPSSTFLVSLFDFKLSGDRCGKPRGPRRDGVQTVEIPAV